MATLIGNGLVGFTWSTVHAFYCIVLLKGGKITRNAPSLFSLNPGYPGNWCFCLRWQRSFWVPRGWRTCRGPQGGSKSEIQLYACSTWCLYLSLSQGSVALGYHLQPWCPLSFFPDAILPWASSQGHMSLMNPHLPDASPACFYTACLCPAITAKDPTAPVMFCLSSAAMITTFSVRVRRLLLLLGLFSLKK